MGLGVGEVELDGRRGRSFRLSSDGTGKRQNQTTDKKKGTKKHEPKQPQSGWTRCTSGQFCRSDSGGKRSVAGAGKKHFDAGGPAAFGKMGAASHERE